MRYVGFGAPIEGINPVASDDNSVGYPKCDSETPWPLFADDTECEEHTLVANVRWRRTCHYDGHVVLRLSAKAAFDRFWLGHGLL
jgi:hypothetical protein